MEDIFVSKLLEKDEIRSSVIFNRNTENTSVNNLNNYLKGDPVCLIFQNTKNYMGGVENVWTNSKDRIGLESINICNQSQSSFSDLIKSEQNYSDGKLECFTYEHGALLAIERFIKGNARKVYHGEGPFLIKFKDIPNVE